MKKLSLGFVLLGLSLVSPTSLAEDKPSSSKDKDKPSPAKEAPKKDTAVIQDTKTGKTFEVKVPKDAAEVKKTGPNTYDVKVNKEAGKKIEVKEVPPPKNQ